MRSRSPSTRAGATRRWRASAPRSPTRRRACSTGSTGARATPRCAACSPTNKLSFLRQPIGASDFVEGPHYTYDDLPAGRTDYRMRRFSIAHDRAEILPLLRQALALNPQIKVIGSPWSPPAWMKTNQSLVGGRLIDTPRIYAAYARYLVKFVKAYERAGVPIYALTVQNEPQNRKPDAYPGMDMPVAQQAKLIEVLGPRLRRARPAHEDPRLRPQLVRARERHRPDAAGRGPRGRVPDEAAADPRRPLDRRHRLPLLRRRPEPPDRAAATRSPARASGSPSARARTARPTRRRRSSPTRSSGTRATSCSG